MTRPAVALGLLLAFLAGPAALPGEESVDRSIGGQPKYVSETKYYALLLLGAKGDTRVWFVLDGNDLYVDRNADGDLLDPDEKVGPARFDQEDTPLVTESRSWVVGSIASKRYTNVKVRFALLNKSWQPAPDASNGRQMTAFMEAAADVPHAQLSHIQVTIDGARRQQSLNTTFGTTPASAPVFRMDAPLTLGLVESFVPFVLFDDPQPQTLSLAFGNAGFGPGSFSFVFSDTLPSDLKPSVELSFPAKAPGEWLPPRTIEIPGRC